ncbi:MAG: ABC transporter ATP-binding protein, partial [Oscillospiraceae bacterium]
TELQSAFASAKRVFEIIDEPAEIPDKTGAVKLDTVDGTLKAQNVSFSYSPEVPLIEDFNLSVKSGQRIAIVGPTGCGKTTFINLLMRFYDVTGGEIILSGVPIKDCTRDSMRSMYGMVLQETWLKTGTVKENIAYGKPDASDEEIIAAAKAAHCHGFIKRLPRGYDTVISGGGGTLSQGQKQLLCIARIMLSLPPMLILDEATSSIDTRTEILIQQTFNKMMEGRTSFIIAHRLSTIREADCILVMNSGHIIEQGTHEQLMAADGFYAELYNSQFSV